GDGLTWSSFMLLTVLCGLMNALVHGAVWSGQQAMSQSLLNLVSMTIGDLVGVVLCLSLVKCLVVICPGCMRQLLGWLARRATA
ncbi:MAG: hypothetical protein ACO3FM_07630, partial [Burkholderiaceae bacterium]